MAKEVRGHKANIGSSSLILIFIVLCLVTFGMLSLSAARNELDLADRSSSAVREYYRADGEGEEFYRLVAEKAAEAWKAYPNLKDRRMYLAQELGEFYQQDRDAAVTTIPMERAQALYVELFLSMEEKSRVTVKKWKVIQTEDYEIDDSMPVWTGAGD